jgi:hypothetical protein
VAFIGLSESSDGDLMLLDEVENGINSGYAQDIIDVFYSMSKSMR